MPAAVPRKVLVNFVGGDQDAVAAADIPQAPQLFPRPDTAYGVVGAAQQVQLDVVVHDFPFHVVEIDFVPAVPQDQVAGYAAPVVREDVLAEGVVDRLVDQDRVAGVRKGADRGGQGEDDAWRLDEPGRVEVPAVLRPEPVFQDGAVPGRVGFAVPVDGMFEAAAQGFRNGRRYGKIHIGHPEGQHVFRIAAPFGGVVFQAVCATAVGNHIKVHGRLLRPGPAPGRQSGRPRPRGRRTGAGAVR